MEGKLYISIQAQSNKVNLNSTLQAFAAVATPTPSSEKATSPSAPKGGTAGSDANPTPTPIVFSPDQARQSLTQQIKDTFQKKSDEDEHFRDEYRNYRIEDLTEEILAWSDLSYESNHEQSTNLKFKKAPFYHISELNFLPAMDDAIYDLLSEQFTAGVSSTINVNSVRESVLKALLPQMTKEEVTKFFEYRDGKAENAAEDNKFKSADDFYNYLKGKVQFFMGSETRVTDLKNGLTQRGIQIITEESNFLIHIEATVQQTKKTLEAMVSLVDPGSNTPPPQPAQNPQNPSQKNPQSPVTPSVNTGDRSNLKITQLRFL